MNHSSLKNAHKLERPKSLTDLAIASIRTSIVQGRLALGAQLSEAALALELGVSKTPVREALLQLRSDGLVDIHPQRGTYVFSVDRDDVVQVCRFREILEPAALAEAMQQDLPGLVAELETNLNASGSGRALPELDAEFHDIIIRRSGNQYLRSAYALVEHKLHALRWRLPSGDAQIAHCQDNHALIVDKVRANKLTQAQILLKRHIRSTREAYLQAGEQDTASRRRSRRSIGA